MSPLLSKTAELALDLLEKNGVLVPFCNVTDHNGNRVHITPDGDGERAEESVRVELTRQLNRQEVQEFAACSDVEAKIERESTVRRCLKIEFQDGTTDSGVYYFPLTLEDGRASLGNYFVADVPKKEL